LGAIPLGPSDTGSSSNAITQAGGSASSKKVKGMLSQNFVPLMHMTEALTELSKALQGSDPTVTARLQELLQLLTGCLIIRPKTTGANTPVAYFGSNYSPRSWAPVGSVSTNYGKHRHWCAFCGAGTYGMFVVGVLISTGAPDVPQRGAWHVLSSGLGTQLGHVLCWQQPADLNTCRVVSAHGSASQDPTLSHAVALRQHAAAVGHLLLSGQHLACNIQRLCDTNL